MKTFTPTKSLIFSLLLIICSCKKKGDNDYSLDEKLFLKEQTEFAKGINKYLESNFVELYSMNQSDFTFKIDSLREIFETHRKSYKGKLSEKTYNNEELGIRSLFDWFILRYPNLHFQFTGNKSDLSKKNQVRIDDNLVDFNKMNSLKNQDFQRYLRYYIEVEAEKKLDSGEVKGMDNQQFNANWKLINELFKEPGVKDYWRKEYLLLQLEDFGIKNMKSFYEDFKKSCKNKEYISEVESVYESHKKSREKHTIEIYKTVDGHQLEMHLFLPEEGKSKHKKPVIVHFHGGSWGKGKPDWFFYTAEEYAAKGWAVAVVEYRIKGRQGTYPFEAVKDAKSAIRWLRKHSKKYRLDSNKIIVTGNSAGGHLALTSVLANDCNEETDNLQISAVPNVVIVNSGVYDLTVRNTQWITEKLEDKETVKKISPNHLVAKTATKFLLIHGEKDKNCELKTAEYFYKKMKNLGNDVKLHVVKGAHHFIWFGEHSRQVDRVTDGYIEKLYQL